MWPVDTHWEWMSSQWDQQNVKSILIQTDRAILGYAPTNHRAWTQIICGIWVYSEDKFLAEHYRRRKATVVASADSPPLFTSSVWSWKFRCDLCAGIIEEQRSQTSLRHEAHHREKDLSGKSQRLRRTFFFSFSTNTRKDLATARSVSKYECVSSSMVGENNNRQNVHASYFRTHQHIRTT